MNILIYLFLSLNCFSGIIENYVTHPELSTGLATKEGTITAATAAEYWRGDKTFQTLNKAAVGLSLVDNTADTAKPIANAVATALAAKEGTITATTSADYYRGDKTFQTLNKTAVGLANVDNVSDASKPVSTAQATAIATAQAQAVSTAAAYTDAAKRVISISGAFTFVEDGTYVLELASDRAKTLSSLVVQLSFGTCTVSIQKNGVSVTGLSSIAITTSLQTFTATALNSIAVDDKITMVVTSSVGASGLAFSLKAL